jgi:hypothetical protein
VSNREVTRNLRDPELLKKARQWLGDCASNHKACRRQGGEKQFNPTRLIHLKSIQEGSVCVIRSEVLASPVAYAALSYCWGGDQPGKTTRQNVAAREKALLLQGQQKTITDAVFVAKKMGLEYLWIDSLCIVQDDPDDTARELPTMHDVYSSASIVISATRARSSRKGFLELHWPLNTNLSFGYRCPDESLGTILLQRAADPSPNEEIHTRCWTLQEHLLARRVLSFGSSGLRWRCRTGLQFDGPWTKDDVIMNYVEQDDTYAEPCWKQMLTKAGPLSPSQIVPDSRTFALNWQDSLLTEWARLKWEWCQDKLLEFSPVSETLQEWRHMVKSNFTQREITSPVDRLPAISAIAAKFNQIIPGRYLAGLWEVALPHELLWEARKLEHVRERDLDSPFPSWSWASLGTSFKEYIEMGMESNTVPPNSVVTLKPHSANIKLKHANVPHGHVLSGSLKLEGYLLPVTCKYLGWDAPYLKIDMWDFPRRDECRVFFIPSHASTSVSAQAHYLYAMLDVVMKEEELREVYCLEIVRRDLHGFKHINLPSAGLVLRRAGADRFTRIGVFNMGEPGNNGWYIPGDKICTRLDEKSNVFVKHASQRVVEVI